MPKVTLDKDTFKALASDTRLDILRALDGKKMSLNDLCAQTKLNKATLHEHLSKLHEAGLVKKKEREGHKWVYYKLSWKGESLLHPENARIVVLFSVTFVALWAGFLQLLWYAKGSLIPLSQSYFEGSETYVKISGDAGNMTNSTLDNTPIIGRLPENSNFALDTVGDINVFTQNPIFLYIAIACFVIFTVVLIVSIWRLYENKTPRL